MTFNFTAPKYSRVGGRKEGWNEMVEAVRKVSPMLSASATTSFTIGQNKFKSCDSGPMGAVGFSREDILPVRHIFYTILIENLHEASSGLMVAPRCIVTCGSSFVYNLLFALILTKETGGTDFKPKLLILITKVIDHHINNRHLVNFRSINFNNSLCIAFS